MNRRCAFLALLNRDIGDLCGTAGYLHTTTNTYPLRLPVLANVLRTEEVPR